MNKTKETVNLIKVKSSHIEGIGLDLNTRSLIIHFVGDRVYRYTPFTTEGFKQFQKADSLGGYFEKNIRHNKLITCEEITNKVEVSYLV